MADSLEARTVRWLKAKEHWPLAAKVSCYNVHSRRAHDLFGIIDVVAVGPRGTLMIQVTSSSNVSARLKKMCQEHTETALSLIRARGVTVEVWGWRKVKRVWQPRKIALDEDTVKTLAFDSSENGET